VDGAGVEGRAGCVIGAVCGAGGEPGVCRQAGLGRKTGIYSLA